MALHLVRHLWSTKSMLFNELGLSAELLRAINKKGYRQTTPIQQQAIPAILDDQDILACAQTGTGKTAGFALPILQRLQKPSPGSHRIQVLILTPTRELAAQVAESMRSYGYHLPFKTTAIFGGVSINTQIAELKKGTDIVVATPGRLLDHIERNTINLSRVDVLVLDEADRMLDMGFIRDIRKILKKLPNKRQNLLFSATFSNEIRRLSADFLNSPIEIQVAARNALADRIEQVVHPVDRARKRALLSHRIRKENWHQVLVFTRTKHGANRLAKQLSKDGLNTVAIHGNKSQGARTRALNNFKNGSVQILVATDIAARGLDIDKLPYVVNYELPHVAEDYVHRIGRTARAGQKGHAVSLVCIDEEKLLLGIERLLKCKIDKKIILGYEPDLRIKAEPVTQGHSQRRHYGGRARATS
jgi:ATP-dependent RNA helicase RhlE